MIYNKSTMINKNPELLIGFLLSTIPKSLKPKYGFPDFYITDSTFHSNCLSNSKKNELFSWEEAEEEYKEWLPNSWAYIQMSKKYKGDVYLALKYRLGEEFEECEICQSNKHSIEGVIFHEIGHNYWYQKDIFFKSGKIRAGFENAKENEDLADIYANACFLNLFQQNPDYKGYYEPFAKKHLEKINSFLKEKIPVNKLLEKGKELQKVYGCI